LNLVHTIGVNILYSFFCVGKELIKGACRCWIQVCSCTFKLSWS